MERIKLVDYQVKAIKSAIKHSFDIIEDMLLDKYNAFMIEDLNATDFDAIMEDIKDYHVLLHVKQIAVERQDNGNR